jgi:hypothetical protein
MRGLLFIVAASLALPAAAERTDLPRPPPRLPVDERPTPFACTFERLLGGERCSFEFDPAPGEPSESLARENSRLAGHVSRNCAEAATRVDELRPDPTLRKMCEDEVARVALEHCTLQGRVALADDDGRVVASGGPCVEELARALSRTRTMAGMALPCCRCLSQSRCSVAVPQCSRELADFAPGDALKSCLEASCHESCSNLRPEPAAPPAQPPGSKVRADRAADTRT